MVQTEINDVKELLSAVDLRGLMDTHAKRASSRLYLLTVAKAEGEVLPKHLKGEFEDGKSEVINQLKGINGMRSEVQEMAENGLFKNQGTEGKGRYELTELGEYILNEYIQSIRCAALIYQARANRTSEQAKILENTEKWVQDTSELSENFEEFNELLVSEEDPVPISGLKKNLLSSDVEREELVKSVQKLQTELEFFISYGENEMPFDKKEDLDEDSLGLSEIEATTAYHRDCLNILGFSMEERDLDVKIRRELPTDEVTATDIQAIASELQTQSFSDDEVEDILDVVVGYLKVKDSESSDLENNLF